MADLIRNYDWDKTPLGPSAHWPQGLKIAVEILLQSEQPGCICWGKDLPTLYNDATITHLGARHPGALGQPYAEIWDDFWPQIEKAVLSALNGQASSLVVSRAGTPSGGQYACWYTFSWAPLRDGDGAVGGFYCTATQSNLRFGGKQLSIILDNISDAVSMLDLSSKRYVYLSPANAELTGFSEDEVKHTTPEDFLAHIHPDDREKIDHPLDWHGSPPPDFELTSEYRWKVKSGEYRWFSVKRRLVCDDAGNPVAVVNVTRDVTETKKVEAELRQSEARYRLLHESLRDGFGQIAMDGKFLNCNTVYCDMLGYSEAELLKLTYLDLTPPRWHRPESDIVAKQVLVRGYSDVYEKEYWHKNGTIIPVELRTILVRDEEGMPSSMYAIVRDTSERRAQEARFTALKEQLIHAGRVQELGQVSAGIAHELNQPLAAMQNYAATARRLIARGDSPAASQTLTKACEQATRASDIIQRMRNFVEKRDTHKKREDVNAILQEAAALGMIGSKAVGIETRYSLAPDLPPVIADRVQIEQVLVNLLHNAMDAMAEGPDRILTLSSRQSAGAIEIIVGDTGRGIPEAVAHCLFQPFVTTKPHGMGIGLAISKSIVEAHGGEIFAEPNPGGGTRFCVRLQPAPPPAEG